MRVAWVAAALAATACGGVRGGPVAPGVQRPGGRVAASLDFELADARGGLPLRLSDSRGKAVIVHYFATWCAPCEAEFQNLNHLAELHAARSDLAILGIAVDLDGAKLLPMFLEVRGLNYPVALADERMLHGETPFGPLPGIPATFLIDAEGRYVEGFRGVVPFSHLQSRLQAVLPVPP